VRQARRWAAGVSDTIRKDVTDVHSPTCWACGYCDSKMSVYMLGMTAALLATAVFLILSSATSMPVSTTHAVRPRTDSYL
jgi:solute carrier family 20 (sodium-dependent phosphate transporter)